MTNVAKQAVSSVFLNFNVWNSIFSRNVHVVAAAGATPSFFELRRIALCVKRDFSPSCTVVQSTQTRVNK